MKFNEKDYVRLTNIKAGDPILPGDGYVKNGEFKEFSASFKNYNVADERCTNYYRKKKAVSYDEILKSKPEFDSSGNLVVPYGWRLMKQNEIFTYDDIFVSPHSFVKVRTSRGRTLSSYNCEQPVSFFNWGGPFFGIRKINQTVNVDGIDVELTADQIKFIESEKNKNFINKNFIKIGDYISYFYRGEFVIARATCDINLQYYKFRRPELNLRRSTPEEIKLYEEMKVSHET